MTNQTHQQDFNKENQKNGGVLFMTGMHRSGSSTLSRAMKTLGIQHTSNLMNASKDNEKGYWEDEDFIEFNDDLLRRTGQLWEHPKLIKNDDISSLIEKHGGAASSLIKKKIIPNNTICLKDPRLCNLGFFWEKICESNQIKFNLIATYRDPLSTASSIHKRDNICIEKGLSIWCTYYLNLLNNIDSHKELILVDYDELIDNTRNELTSLSQSLEKTLIEDEYITYSEQFLDTKLRHNSQKLESNSPIEVVSKEIREVLDLIKGNRPRDLSDWSSRLNKLHNSLVKADPELSENSTTSKFKELFALHYIQSEQHISTICETRQDIRTLHSWLNQSKQETQTTKTELNSTAAALAQAQAELSEAQNSLNETYGELERVKALRQATRKRHAETLKQFHQLTQTSWWKAATPLRSILSSRRDRATLKALKSRIRPDIANN